MTLLYKYVVSVVCTCVCARAHVFSILQSAACQHFCFCSQRWECLKQARSGSQRESVRTSGACPIQGTRAKLSAVSPQTHYTAQPNIPTHWQPSRQAGPATKTKHHQYRTKKHTIWRQRCKESLHFKNFRRSSAQVNSMSYLQPGVINENTEQQTAIWFCTCVFWGLTLFRKRTDTACGIKRENRAVPSRDRVWEWVCPC